jgi:hypothetical protein
MLSLSLSQAGMKGIWRFKNCLLVNKLWLGLDAFFSRLPGIRVDYWFQTACYKSFRSDAKKNFNTIFFLAFITYKVISSFNFLHLKALFHKVFQV